MDEQNRTVEPTIRSGQRVYDSDGRLLGHVNAVSSERLEVELLDADGTSKEEIPGQELGEGYLMWQCDECGEMGDIDDGIPERCPDCGAPREAIEKVRED